jgi:hypothetical protein
MSLRLTTSHENSAIIPAQAGIHPDLSEGRGGAEVWQVAENLPCLSCRGAADDKESLKSFIYRARFLVTTQNDR